MRTLVEDIGEQLGCGAHVSSLRRTAVGEFPENQMHMMDELEVLAEQGMASLDALLQPMDCALAHWPDVRLSRDVAFFVKRGQPVRVPRAPARARGWVKLYTSEENFLGIGHILDDGRVAPKRLFQQQDRQG